jgi:uncharacterized protein
MSAQRLVPDGPPGPLELLVVQPTPFCNINCSYCYLPDRQNTRRMSAATLEQTFAWVFASGLVRQPFTLLWHAGEPLVLPPDFYEQALELLGRHNRDGIPVHHSFQTNATLIDEAWCDLVRRHGIHVGVSVDGPAFLHDRHRRTRQGQGTLDRVLRGLHLLHDHGIPFHVITVLTADALLCPDELFDFYQEHGIRRVGFNVEEIEGPHTLSSLSGRDTPARFRDFFARFLELALTANPPLEVREFDSSAIALLGPRYGPGARTQESRPWAIVNVDCEGNFSTYSPELLGTSSGGYESFTLGNVARDSLQSVLESPLYRRMEAEIGRGVERCRSECRYFPFCGGGAPANKLFENGRFDSTETLFCRLHRQVCLEVSLARLERCPPVLPPAAGRCGEAASRGAARPAAPQEPPHP